MRASVFHGTGDIRVEDVPDPEILEPSDAIVRITHACICGSDLWFYRGVAEWEPGWRTGHEWMGVVEEVGRDVTRLRPGDHVIAPFTYSDGTCEFCRKNVQTSCVNGGAWGGETNDGGQGEAVRAPLADTTLVTIPPEVTGDDDMMKRILPLTDVMGTGHHANVLGRVRPGATVAVVGDGAVGLCAVLGAARLGAERILALGHHEERLQIAKSFGATELWTSSGEDLIGAVLDSTDGGVGCVLECVGNQSAMDTAVAIARPGGAVSFVGVPAEVDTLDAMRLFQNNIALNGGVAPVRAYLPELLADVVGGKLDPSPVLDLTVELDRVPDGYAAMDQRRAVKVMVTPN